jgi:hypothetical protein
MESSCECDNEPSGNYQVATQMVAPRVASSSIELVSYILCCQLDILGFTATTYILVKKLNIQIIKMLKFVEI